MLDQPRPIAVAIPCFNEAAAVVAVVASWREALPDAEVIVFDNNSTDGTGDLARGLGLRVILVPQQGKGHVVQAIFAELQDRPVVLMVDGDGTYPASAARRLIAPILDGSAEMTVGARQPVAEIGAMSPVRGLGNVLIRAAFRVLIGRGPGDLLSGYRAFSPRFLKAVQLRSSGFEIETELAGAAVAGGFKTVEIAVPYFPRIAGTASKLRAFRDGRRILMKIIELSLRLRPWRIATLIVAAAGLLWLVWRSVRSLSG